MNWYIIRVAKGQDNRVKNALKEQIQRYKAESQVGDIVIPTEKEVKMKNGKKVVKSKNMLAGYVLLNADLNDKLIEIIKNTPGCYGFMGDAKTPVPLKQSEVDKMLGNVSEDEIMLEQWINGQRIKITDGPFKNFEGTINGIDDFKKKLKVEVKVFGRPTPLELDYHSVEKTND